MKTASRILMAFSILVFFTGMSFAQVATTATPAKTSTKSVSDVPVKANDANKAGTCVNHDAKGPCAQGKNFVDKNGDGKCDNCGSTGTCKGTGNGCGKGPACGSGCSKGQGTGTGCGQGHQHRNGCTQQGNTAPAAQPKK